MATIVEITNWSLELAPGELYRFEFEPEGGGRAEVNCDGVPDFAIRCQLSKANNALKQSIEQGGYLEYRGATYNPRAGLVYGWIRRTTKPFALATSMVTAGLTDEAVAVNFSPVYAQLHAETTPHSIPVTFRDIASFLQRIISQVTGGIGVIFKRVWQVVDEGLTAVGDIVGGIGTTARLLPIAVLALVAAVGFAVATGRIQLGRVV